MMPTNETDDDPSDVYDRLCEAASRLEAVYNQRATIGGVEDPEVQEMRATIALVKTVKKRDVAAQKAMTADLDERYNSLTED
jgi:hypothetical protein